MADNNAMYVLWVLAPILIIWFFYQGERSSKTALLIRVGLLVILVTVVIAFHFNYRRLKIISGQNIGDYNANPLGTMKERQ